MTIHRSLSLTARLLPLLALGGATPSPAEPLAVPGATLTLRAKGKASVVERRIVRLLDGEFELQWEGVSQRLDPNSLQLRFPDKPVTVLDQRFESGQTSRDALMRQCVGERVQLVQRAGTGNETQRLAGTVLSVEGGRPAALQLDTGEVLLNPGGEVLLPPLPEAVTLTPRVVWRLRPPGKGAARAELTYLTDGLDWSANYVLTLSADLREAEITGWVTLTNGTGITFSDAQLRLESVETRKVESLQPVTETEVVEYPLVGLTQPLTLAADEPLRVPLLSPRVVPLERVSLFDPLGATPAGPTPPQKLKSVVRLRNADWAGLGVSLPAGSGMIYQETDRGTKVVSDRGIPGVGADKDLEIVLGDVGNLEGTRKQTAFREVAERTQEQDIEIQFNNKTGEWVEAVAVEHPWPQWEILEASHFYTTRADKALEFPVMCAPKAITTVTYRVRMKY